MPTQDPELIAANIFKEVGLSMKPGGLARIVHEFTDAEVPGDLMYHSTTVGWPSGCFLWYYRNDFNSDDEYAQAVLQGVMDSANEYLIKSQS